MARKWYFTASLLFSQETYPNVFFYKKSSVSYENYRKLFYVFECKNKKWYNYIDFNII